MGANKYSICRNCPHFKFAHYSACYASIDDKRIGHAIPCDCPEFVPLDNLEYLEWKVDKQNASR